VCRAWPTVAHQVLQATCHVYNCVHTRATYTWVGLVIIKNCPPCCALRRTSYSGSPRTTIINAHLIKYHSNCTPCWDMKIATNDIRAQVPLILHTIRYSCSLSFLRWRCAFFLARLFSSCAWRRASASATASVAARHASCCSIATASCSAASRSAASSAAAACLRSYARRRHSTRLWM
jgi:hypothetical protein